MGDELSVHDNIIYAFSVDCEARKLILYTSFRGREPHDFTDIIFHDVVVHHFAHVLPGNILFDVEEVEVEALVRENANLLADSWRYGWPPIEYCGNLEVLVGALQAAAIHAYAISSSLGLSGWVLAGGCQRRPRCGAMKMD